MNEIILAKYGELALKGHNRASFENRLLKTVKLRAAAAGDFDVYRAQSTIYIQPRDGGVDIDKAVSLITKVFGIAAVNRAAAAAKDVLAITDAACRYLADNLRAANTFKVSCKRSDKRFPLNSMELAAEAGRAIIERFSHLSGDMKDPDCEVVIEVRDFAAYVHGGKIKAAGGMPTGTSGRAAALLSGGIDSPVAAYMMAKRGLDVVGVHFMSPPYTGERALDKVERIAHALSLYTGNFPLLCVPFTDVQVKIHRGCPEPLETILTRRSMMRIAAILAEKENCKALVTGESLAQVASQTLGAICCTDAAVNMPVLRPLIGMDKVEITFAAKEIGTFDISILPYEDCCTVFTPRHPKTNPKLAEVQKAESALELAALEQSAADGVSVKVLHFSGRR